MAQYLTPSKIVLLRLTELYCDGYVSLEATIPVLSFIAKQLTPKTQNAHRPQSGFLPLQLEHFKGLLDTISEAENTGLWNELLRMIWKLSNLNSLFDFFHSLRDLLLPRAPRSPGSTRYPPIQIAKTSLLGVFVRRAMVEFEKLPFHDVASLWQAFESFRRPTESEWDSLHFEDSQRSLDDEDDQDIEEISMGKVAEVLNQALERSKPEVNTISSFDQEALLKFQIEHMQKYGNRLPEEMKVQLDTMIRPSSEVSSLSQYARFLDSWYSGDYPSSFESLHRYHDYAMLKKDRSQYQYALLNMAILQADFGCHDEAIAAMHETIAAARESKDMACLNFSLSWLYHFRSVYGRDTDGPTERSLLGSDAESLEFLRSKAREGEMFSIVSPTLLNEAKLSLSKGKTPGEAFRHIHESSYLNVTKYLTSTRSAQLILQSSLFDRLGISSLANSYSNLVLTCYADTSLVEDVMRARCRSAYTALLAGNYAGAAKALDKLDPDLYRNLQHVSFITCCVSMLKLKKAILNNDLDLAESLLESLINPPRADPEMIFQIDMMRVDYNIARGDLGQALSRIDSMAEKCEKQGADVYHRIRLLCAKALLFARIKRPQKGMSLAIRAIAAAQRSLIMPALWEASVALAGVLNGLAQFEAARDVLSAVVYQAQESEDIAIVANISSRIADAEMGLAGQAQDDQERTEQLKKALKWVKSAHGSFTTIEAVLAQAELKAKEARIMKLLESSN